MISYDELLNELNNLILNSDLTDNVITDEALWQQAAEEAIELAHACLKVARKLHRNGSTPVDFEDLIFHAEEEAADVSVCLDVLCNSSFMHSTQVMDWKVKKLARWVKRVTEEQDNNG